MKKPQRCRVYETRIWHCEDCAKSGWCGGDCGHGEPYTVKVWRCNHYYGLGATRCWSCGETGWSTSLNGGHGATPAQLFMHHTLSWMSWLHRFPVDEQDLRECLYGPRARTEATTT